jgi:ketosteroid isomerase-like protein
MSTPTDTSTQQSWTVEGFAAFWDAPDAALVPAMLTDDVVGYWPGGEEVRGRQAYTDKLAEIIAAVPGIRLEVAESAVDGDCTFVRWIMHATGPDGPFEFSGIDRVRTRDGLVCENVIRFDSRHLEELLGGGA